MAESDDIRSAIATLKEILQLFQASNLHSPKAFRIAQKKTGLWWMEYDQAERSSCER
jgi:hypothetical protein